MAKEVGWCKGCPAFLVMAGAWGAEELKALGLHLLSCPQSPATHRCELMDGTLETASKP